MTECKRKIDRELALLDNPIVTKHTGVAKTPTKYTGTARSPTKYTGAARTLTKPIVTEYTSMARNPTKNITSAASKTMDISMISAAPFNHLVQKPQRNPKI